ncbi:hypothetical protein MVEN_01560800 [Mycena venus]|uniref:Uncharacterized protein n=1 Tax=Mycena venus TaxID=2733690 RepID=A0A8H6XQ54_9AGAR|nr:hypothetical protein MVEN_01560800 [Mycena venus]
MAVTGAVAPISLVASSWLNVALFTLELVLCGHYFARPRPLTSRIAIGTMVLADTVCTLAIVFEVGLAIDVTKEHFRFVVALAVKIITTYTSAAITQLSFCRIFYALPDLRTGNKLVSCALIFLIFVHLGFSWASGVLLVKFPELGPDSGIAFTVNTYVTHPSVRAPTMSNPGFRVGAVTCAATDLVVALCLGFKFFKMMQDTIPGYRTRSLVRRILTLSVGSGAICATNTLVMLMLLLEGSTVFNFLGTIQGRIYALSILANFLLGLPGRPRDATTSPSSIGGRPTLSSVAFTVPSSMITTQKSRPSANTANASKSAADRARFTASTSFSYIDQCDEALHLHDLRPGSLNGKVNSE